ncbi:DUF349 domain-containing protein [uncultured Draconibacterium sp.]|uniref:DUF349 domain-containing protein n=1 Tax=uncultured Draconibacterium sp. TaxID=1573823 RepID=UPI002AA954B2|nr:DUF349 domain-containing protein [uncultured Draconibacterium sp.]
MEPKDLKNSEELKRTEKSELKNSEVEATSDEATNPDNTKAVDDKEVTESKPETESVQKDEPVEETPKEDEKAEDNSEEKSVVTETETTEDTKDDSSEEAEEKNDTDSSAVEAEQKKPEEEDQETNKEEEVKVKKQEPEPKPEKEPVDYSKHTQVELVNALRDILEEEDVDFEVKDEIEAIKAVFYKNLNESIEEEKKKFIDAGGNEEDFKPEDDPYEKDIKDLLKKYRQIRIDFNKKLEVEKEDNLQKKYDVIEKIKGLINNEESINKTFNEFRDLQREWREIGLVPQSKMKDLWDTYHFHVENFYDYIKINRELRDLDLKKNLEAKIKLCERAEELLVDEPSILKAFNTLQKYHDQWREIGPVPREQKDDIWERFKAATTKINKKHQEFFENRKVEQKKNLEAKTALCEKAEEIIQEEITKHKDWDEKSKQLIELQKVWRTIGFAPRKDNNKIYERFRTACDKFFDAKRAFYAKNKESQQNNLQLKTDLCVQAESLKDSTDWKKTTQDFINIQKKWKEIGPVPRKHSDILWKRFRAACDYFFDKKSEHFSDVDSEQVDNLKLKEELIKEVQNFKPADNNDKNLESLKEFQRRWTEIGHVPFKKKDEVKVLFRDAVNKLFDELNIDEEKRNILKFRNKMSSFSESSRGQNKMRMERDKYMNKMKQLENDLVLLDNNIGFFAKSKNAESLIEDVKKKIEVTKQKIELLRDKIRVIDEMDSDE